MAIAVINSVPADAHAFRVTLNLLLHSTACPAELTPIIEKLKAKGWDRNALGDNDLQNIYGLITPEVCDAALSEWSVDTRKMRDHGYPYSADDWMHWFTGDHSVDCRLCGHKHNRFEFPMENSNGNVIWTGSTCIQKFGVVVNGEATAERALELLRKAMGRSKKMQTCSQWQEARPDHEEVMNLLGEALEVCKRRVPYRMYRSMPLGWNRSTHELAKRLRGALKYHTKNGYLTDQRTFEVWEPIHDEDGVVIDWVDGNLIKSSRGAIASWKQAEADDPVAKVAKFWDAWLKTHSKVLEDWQRRKIEYFKSRGYSREQLYPSNEAMLASVEAALARKDKPEVEDDYSDMAW